MFDEKALSSNIDDTYPEYPLLDKANLGKPLRLDSLPKDKDGYTILKSGYYSTSAKTYCMRPVTYYRGAPGGNGYGIAPLRGRDAELFRKLIVQGEAKKVPQSAVQADIWALISKNYEHVVNDPNAKALLSPEEMADLQQRIAAGHQMKALGGLWQSIEKELPSDVRKFIAQEKGFYNSFTDFTSGKGSFAQLERTAVLLGEPPSKDTKEIPPERWVLAPKGYFMRFNHGSGYSGAKMEYYLPAEMDERYDPLGRPIFIVNTSTGLRIDIEYFSDDLFVVPEHYPSLKVYPFKSVTILIPAGLHPKGKEIRSTIKNRGYIITGSLNGLKTSSRQSPEPIPDDEFGSRIANASLQDIGKSKTDEDSADVIKIKDKVKEQVEEKIEKLIHEYAEEHLPVVTKMYDIHKAYFDEIGAKGKWESAKKIRNVIQTLQNKQIGSIDKARAIMDMADYIPNTEAFGMPLSIVKDILKMDLDYASHAVAALGGRSGAPKQDEDMDVWLNKDIILNDVGVAVPPNENKQRIGGFLH